MEKLIRACAEMKYRVIDFDTFKKIHQNETEGRDMLIANIREVQVFNVGVTITFNNDKKITALNNGLVYKGHYRNNPSITFDKGRARVVGLGKYKLNTSIYSEFIWGIAGCYLNDKFPESVEGLVVNVMDGTGNAWTANKLKSVVNCHPSNLEWTTEERNSSHGQIIKKLMKKNCKAYRFSSWDDEILKAAKEKDWYSVKMQLAMIQEV